MNLIFKDQAAVNPEKAELRIISGQLRDLLDSGQLVDGRGHELTVNELVDHLSDTPLIPL